MIHGIDTPFDAINLLHPDMRPQANLFMKLAKKRGLNVVMFETKRTPERQRHLFNKKYSKLKSGSMHEYGLAIDVVFNSSEPWDGKHPWDKLGQIGKDLGLYWGGLWESFLDRPHFQLIPAEKRSQALIRRGKFPLKPMPILRKGSYGHIVKVLQVLINNKYNKKLSRDGDYGNKTHQAVEQIQRKNKLTMDGVCMGGTWNALI